MLTTLANQTPVWKSRSKLFLVAWGWIGANGYWICNIKARSSNSIAYWLPEEHGRVIAFFKKIVKARIQEVSGRETKRKTQHTKLKDNMNLMVQKKFLEICIVDFLAFWNICWDIIASDKMTSVDSFEKWFPCHLKRLRQILFSFTCWQRLRLKRTYAGKKPPRIRKQTYPLIYY